MRVAVLANADKAHALDLARQLVPWLAERSIAVVTTPDLAQVLPYARAGVPTDWGPTDLAVVLGGDGTLLQAGRMLAELAIPLFGVNLGHMGFLTEIEGDDLFRRLPDYLFGRCEVEERAMLQVSTHVDSGCDAFSGLAFNDAVISRVPFSRLLRIEVQADKAPVATYLADGMIVASPTGSTAYSLAAGGPVLDPSLDALVVTPICAYSFGSRPIVVPTGRTLRMREMSGDRDVVLTLDGQDTTALGGRQWVSVSAAGPRVRFVRSPGWNFYSVLRRKMAEGPSAEAIEGGAE